MWSDGRKFIDYWDYVYLCLLKNRRNFYLKFILVYSVDSQESFGEVRRLLAEIYEAKGQNSGLGAPAQCVGMVVGASAR